MSCYKMLKYRLRARFLSRYYHNAPASCLLTFKFLCFFFEWIGDPTWISGQTECFVSPLVRFCRGGASPFLGRINKLSGQMMLGGC
jgi:hypothetical protein